MLATTVTFVIALSRWGLSSLAWVCLAAVAILAIVFCGIEIASDLRRPKVPSAANRPAA